MDALSRHFYRWEASVPFMPTYNLLLRVALHPGPGPGPGPPPALFNIACPNVSYCRAVLLVDSSWRISLPNVTQIYFSYLCVRHNALPLQGNVNAKISLANFMSMASQQLNRMRCL